MPADPTVVVPAASGSPQGIALIRDRGLYLNSALDVVGAGRLPLGEGSWELRYEFYAIGFPLLTLSVELDITNWDMPKASVLSQETG